MALTPREQQILDLLRADPLLNAEAIAERIGSTRASVAVTLSQLTRAGEILGRGYLVRREPSAVVVGGANMDIKARSTSALRLATSNPGSVVTTPGGVGRNIAENLARLGRRTHLVAAVGADALGEQLVSRTSAAGVRTDRVVTSPHATGTYLAVLDETGELVVGISDMAATDALQVEDVAAARDLVSSADLLVLDGNLPATVVAWLLDLAAAHAVPVVLEPVSVAKARVMGTTLGPHRPVLAVTPNIDELGALVGHDVANSRPAISAAARELHDRGVEQVWVRRGPRGSLLSSARGDAGRPDVVAIEAPTTEVVDVTGAGDSMTAAFVHAILRGDDPRTAAEYGHRAAALTVASPDTVRPDLSDALIQQRPAQRRPAPQ